MPLPTTLSLADFVTQVRALIQASKAQEAAQLCQDVIQAVPQEAVPRGELALVLYAVRQLDDAITIANTALELSDQCATAHAVLGLVASIRNKPHEAIPHLERAARLQPDFAVVQTTLGHCYDQTDRRAEGLRCYDKILMFAPAEPTARFNRALSWLAHGDYERGWPEYEWRWLTGQLTRPDIPRPKWDGSSLEGRAILIHTEQGIGDAIQLVRLLPILKAMGARVVFACQKAVQQLLKPCAGIDEWMPIDEQTSVTFDCYAPMLALPGLLHLNERTIPRTVPYVFPEPARVEKWKPIVEAIPGFKVGICWQGSATYLGDAHRSIPLKHFAPLAAIPGVTLVSLQRGFGSEQIAATGLPVTVLPGLDEGGGAMMDTAAVMPFLDLVIGCDSAVPHLAGAMGRPVWAALSQACDWRWMMNRDDSVWYPTMRVFRQTTLDDWAEMFTRMAAVMQERLANPGAPPPPPFAAARPCRVEVSPAELFDKLTILEIKAARIGDPAKLANIRAELAEVLKSRDAAIPYSARIEDLIAELKAVNEQIWDLEDGVRACERTGDFGPRFVELARQVYKTNDRRAAVKRQLNERLQARLVEEKSYAAYQSFS